MLRDSIFQAIYYGGITPWEGRVAQTKEYREQAQRSCELHDEVCSLLSDEGKKLFDDFLNENSKLTTCFEEEKFADGFILGARLMMETLQDRRFLKEGE